MSLKARGATLVELLTVCGIVAILTAIVTSVFLVARGPARATTCVGNLQNLDKAYKMYQTDNDGRYPPYPWLGVDGKPARRTEFIASLRPYRVTDAILFCPADTRKKTEFTGEWHDFKDSSYVLIDVMLAMLAKPETGNHVFLSADMVNEPSKIVQTLDQTWIMDNRETGESERFSAHGKVANALYVDGHIKALPCIKP